MKILMSLSSAYTKGDRVAYKQAKDEWYTGTVSTVRGIRVTVAFDDGGRDSFDRPTSRTLKIITSKKKRKTAFTDVEVQGLSDATTGIQRVAVPTTGKNKWLTPVVVKVAPSMVRPIMKGANDKARALYAATQVATILGVKDIAAIGRSNIEFPTAPEPVGNFIIPIRSVPNPRRLQYWGLYKEAIVPAMSSVFGPGFEALRTGVHPSINAVNIEFVYPLK